MKKYTRLLATYAGIATAAMVLYAPWLVGLTPSDPSILRAGLSVICGIVLAGSFGASTYAYLREPEYHLLNAGEVRSADDVVWQLRDLAEQPVVGTIARDAARQVEDMERRSERLERTISAAFGSSSLSHDKFMAVVESARLTLLRNCALLANRVQAFDVEGYRRMGRHVAKADQPILADSVHLQVFEDTLADMREVSEANEHLLLEMGKLEMELSDLDGEDTDQENARTLEQIDELLGQMKYYH